MSPNDQAKILAELVKMDPTIEDLDFNEQYMKAFEVYNTLPDWEQYALVDMFDAVTMERKWYWRRKS